METDEKLEKAASCKDAGNVAFKEQNNARACKLWQRALKTIEHDDKFSAEDKRRAKEIQKGCNLNLAAAQLKLGLHRAAVSSCDKVCRHNRAGPDEGIITMNQCSHKCAQPTAQLCIF